MLSIQLAQSFEELQWEANGEVIVECSQVKQMWVVTYQVGCFSVDRTQQEMHVIGISRIVPEMEKPDLHNLGECINPRQELQDLSR